MTPAQLHAISPLSPIEIGVFPSSCSLRPPPSRRIRSSPQLSYCSTPCTPIAELSPDAHQGYSLTTGRIIRRKPRSIHPIPEVEPLPSFTIDSTVGHTSLDPMNYATALHSKPRARQLRLKAASSPSIGPSPLRNVVTPAEVSDSVMAKQTSLGNPGYNHIGLGFPSSPPHRRHVPRSSTPLREDGDDDADILMEVLRELVEEATAWDPSMSMNKNFKALIHNSTVSSSEESKTSSTDSSNSSSQSPSINTTLSAEVDLVLLGVDIYPGDTPVALRQDVLRHGSAKERAMQKFDLPSFWDDQDSSTADSDKFVR
ncbi:hypothetical protein DL96DRAFT_1553964 [Flagelloscypha sp. PMI_526]|nr:hypothetical protein DL96DRAFT_1553964 [Flagelloscypha sp. PMI_526]